MVCPVEAQMLGPSQHYMPSANHPVLIASDPVSFPFQLCCPCTVTNKSSYQEDHAVRPLHVLPPHAARDQAAATL